MASRRSKSVKRTENGDESVRATYLSQLNT